MRRMVTSLPTDEARWATTSTFNATSAVVAAADQRGWR